MLGDPLLVVSRLASVFDAMGVPYFVGGSLASSIHGTPRSTQDVDLVADLLPSRVPDFVAALAGEFYVDDLMIREAMARGGAFNVVHVPTMFKADVFLMQHDAWSVEEMARARREQVHVEDLIVHVRFATPEDTLLHELTWYKLGDLVSDRQWADVRGIVRVQGTALDLEYLRHWARALGVDELLHRALQEA